MRSPPAAPRCCACTTRCACCSPARRAVVPPSSGKKRTPGELAAACGNGRVGHPHSPGAGGSRVALLHQVQLAAARSGLCHHGRRPSLSDTTATSTAPRCCQTFRRAVPGWRQGRHHLTDQRTWLCPRSLPQFCYSLRTISHSLLTHRGSEGNTAQLHVAVTGNTPGEQRLSASSLAHRLASAALTAPTGPQPEHSPRQALEGVTGTQSASLSQSCR